MRKKDKLADAQTIHLIQKMAEANYKLYQQLEEANEIMKKIAQYWSGSAGKQWCPVFRYLEKYNIWSDNENA